ncbi:uncharacterized protein LOC144792140 [Lissotriton helveticus]
MPPQNLTKKSIVSICSWNVHGFQEMAHDHETLAFFLRQDIIMTQETWKLQPSPIPGFKRRHIHAESFSKHGHPRGGLSTYITHKYNWRSEEIDVGLKWAQVIRIFETPTQGTTPWQMLLFNVYIHPDKKSQKEKYAILVSLIKAMQRTYYLLHPLVISGDFNNKLIDHNKAKVKKPTDCIGKKLASSLTEHGLSILNGNNKGDRPAAGTYLSCRAHSIIDYSIVSDELLPRIESFYIEQRAESDHFSQLIRLNIVPSTAPTTTSLLLHASNFNLRKLKWRGEVLGKITDLVKTHLANLGTQKEEEQVPNWEQMIQVLQDKFPARPGTRSKCNIKKEPWLDTELRAKKRAVAKEVRQLASQKTSGSVVNKSKLRGAKSIYRKALRAAKYKYEETIWNKLLIEGKHQNSRDFWGIINDLNQGVKLQQEAGVGADTWTRHVQALYSKTDQGLANGSWAVKDNSENLKRANSKEHRDPEHERPSNGQKEPDDLTSIKELRKIILRLKSEGAAGPKWPTECNL